MHRRPSLILGVGALALAGCSGSVNVPSAAQSTDASCSRALVAIRGLETLDGRPRREVTSQATAAWGDDGTVQLRCGVTALAPSTDPCQTIGRVDWVIHQAQGRTTFTAFGRQPTVEVSVAGTTPSGTDAILDALAPAAQAMPSNARKCL